MSYADLQARVEALEESHERTVVRVDQLERWRDKIDEERGVIMGDLGEIKGILSVFKDTLRDISEKLGERPSRVEMQAAMKPRGSLFPKITEMEVIGPWNIKFRLFGVSGIVIFLALALIVAAVTLIFLTRH